MSKNSKATSSPRSTGGSGEVFEQNVGALFLALLLLRAPIPVIKNSQIEKVHFQTKRMGWNTDDLLIECQKADGKCMKLIAQIKCGFTVGQNETCIETFSRFWEDFNGEKFDSENDRLVLMVQRGTHALLNDFNNLLTQARASEDSVDFVSRLEKKCGISNRGQIQAVAIREIIDCNKNDNKHRPITDEEYWGFLLTIHVVSYDFSSDIGQTEASIKAFLAHMVNHGDAITAADNTWNELLSCAGKSIGMAKSFQCADLPLDLQKIYDPINSKPEQIFKALLQHGEFVLSNIKTTIGRNANVLRKSLMGRALKAVNEHQIVVITAPAGMGKSAIAKQCIEELSKNFYCFSFRAEEFAVAHIDEILSKAQVKENGVELLNLLVGHEKKIIFVDSIEKILSSTTTLAFTHLLKLVCDDSSLTLLLTCRDNSFETINSEFFTPKNLKSHLINIPKFTLAEVDEVTASEPGLKNALVNPKLKLLLRAPYLLAIAARINWSNIESLPENERDFRNLCWKKVIRKDHERNPVGQPKHREQVFLEIAMQRTRNLSTYVSTKDLDVGALESLLMDDLVVKELEPSTRVALSHDVLEDWAVIRWLEQIWVGNNIKPWQDLANKIDEYPAIHSSYRKWLYECLQMREVRIDDCARSVFWDPKISARFQASTLECMLKPTIVVELLNKMKKELLDNNSNFFVKVINLVRASCNSRIYNLNKEIYSTSEMLLDSEDVWLAVLNFVSDNLVDLKSEHSETLILFLEDFVNSVNAENLEPKGFHQAAQIGFSFLSYFENSNDRDRYVQVLKILAKIPTGSKIAFIKLIEKDTGARMGGQFNNYISTVLLHRLDGWITSRLFPKKIISLFNSKIILTEQDLNKYSYSADDVTNAFGIRNNLEFDFNPASSVRSIFFPLLQFHPEIGFTFIIGLLNHAGDWYGKQKFQSPYIKKPYQIEIEIQGKSKILQWANSRLWNLYRGQSVGPEILQCALMALEKWFFNMCDSDEVSIDYWLLRAIKESNNVMATAVVASVCNYQPAKASHAGVALLSAPNLFYLEKERVHKEQFNHTRTIAQLDSGGNEIFFNERIESNELHHRKDDLERLAVKLQDKKLDVREIIISLLNRYWSSLPLPENQSHEEMCWRLVLHNIDTRYFVQLPTPVSQDDLVNHRKQNIDSSENVVYAVPGSIEPNLQRMINKNLLEANQQFSALKLFNWGIHVWQNHSKDNSASREWRSFLKQAQDGDVHSEPNNILRQGPCIVSAICVRDHLDDMAIEDREWCIQKLIMEIENESDSKDFAIYNSSNILKADRLAALMLPKIATQKLPKNQIWQVRISIARALTHACKEVRIFAGKGIRDNSEAGLSVFYKFCVKFLVSEALLISERIANEMHKDFIKRTHESVFIFESQQSTRSSLIKIADELKIESNTDCDIELELHKLNLDDWYGRHAARVIIMILGSQINSDYSVLFYRRIADVVVNDWNDTSPHDNDLYNKDTAFIFDCLPGLACFVLNLNTQKALHVCEPFLSAVSKNPREVTHFLHAILGEESSRKEASNYWSIWNSFANAIVQAPWIDRIDSSYGYDNDIISSIFLNGGWNKNFRHWPKLSGNNHYIDELAAKLKFSTAVFNAYTVYLYEIGEASLPHAFVILADSLKSHDDPVATLSLWNSSSCLEALLRRYIYEESDKLRLDSDTGKSVMYLLERLVDFGSSASYRMRNDFISLLKNT
ncbi:MAG: ATP-binding protein [Gammaproteobacteria bacterium]|nr:ATP-binding protein [Gammaproteobacteria bacterium]